jgi:hypothetical protein
VTPAVAEAPAFGFHSQAPWTNADAWAAETEAWNVWDCPGSDNGPFQICQVDEIGDYPEDDAWLHVWLHAAVGSVVHRRALDFVRVENPQEFDCIVRHVARLPGLDLGVPRG